MDSRPHQVDVAIIGGSYAGLSAALQLARTRRPIVVIDAGVRRNRFASESHGLIGHDGHDPTAIATAARANVLAYPTARWLQGTAVAATADGDGFTVATDDGQAVAARRLVFAPGVVDTLPDIAGLQERWGTSVFHCPYCHGYEVGQGRVAVIATGPGSHHQAMLLPDWGEVTYFLNGSYAPDEAQLAELRGRGVTVDTTAIRGVRDRATVVLADGRHEPFAGLFTATRTHIASPLPAALGCALDDGPLGSFIRTDATKATTVRGVFACGDAARGAGTVALAVGDGAQAGVSAHRSLVFGTWAVA